MKSDIQVIKEYTYGNGEIEKIFDVFYVHYKMDNGDDLYVTKYGLAYMDNLLPGSFLTDQEWFNKNALRLSGTSCTYKIRTKPLKGAGLDLVLKWNRMGQEIPGAHESDDFIMAEFNSPFEEFSLVMELRHTRYESEGVILTQKPLAIYVPVERMELWQSGRQEYKMQNHIKKHIDIPLDIFRPYITIYKWITGIDCIEANDKGFLSREEMERLTLKAEKEMREKGFIVKDRKPHHIIVKPIGKNRLLRDRTGEIHYALIDFELLIRTPEREEDVKLARRHNYLVRQRDRFKMYKPVLDLPYLKHVNIMGVDYIFGHVESTGGLLWVVGNDPDLFDYFLPERWENASRTRLSSHSEIYHTLTKDSINLVWRLSKTGIIPSSDPFYENNKSLDEYGVNSPFEELSLAIYLNKYGVNTTFPRAIYMSGSQGNHIDEALIDDKRFKTHSSLLTPDNKPILSPNYNYFIIWGYWNGPDEMLAVDDTRHYESINALAAYRENHISLSQYLEIMEQVKTNLAKVGVIDLNFKGNHILLAFDSDRKLIKNEDDCYDVRICNFEFLKVEEKCLL